MAIQWIVMYGYALDSDVWLCTGFSTDLNMFSSMIQLNLMGNSRKQQVMES